MRRRTHKKRQAFTLIEVLLVAGILAVLAAFAIPQLYKRSKKAKIMITEAAVGRNGPIAKGLEDYRFDMGKYPETDDGLAALFQKKDSRDDEDDPYDGPYMRGSIQELVDPWSHPFEFRSPGEFHEDEYDLWSWGPDGVDDEGKEGSDDVKNWIET